MPVSWGPPVSACQLSWVQEKIHRSLDGLAAKNACEPTRTPHHWQDPDNYAPCKFSSIPGPKSSDALPRPHQISLADIGFHRVGSSGTGTFQGSPLLVIF